MLAYSNRSRHLLQTKPLKESHLTMMIGSQLQLKCLTVSELSIKDTKHRQRLLHLRRRLSVNRRQLISSATSNAESNAMHRSSKHSRMTPRGTTGTGVPLHKHVHRILL